jgi:propionyl-CoA carboxylase alpha chain
VRKVLIANRGEIARRVIRAARQRGLCTVAVYSDADAGALYVREADEAVNLPGTAARDTYLASDLLIEAAVATGADALHPGYGFLSENAAFAAACVDAGLIFVGPPPAAIALMGDKLGAKQIMADHGVPVLGSVTAEAGSVPDIEEILQRVGLPAIIKASAGGGGRGMRIVSDADQIGAALDSARREAESAFGDPTVFIERYLAPARHIEVQVFADRHGGVATLFERECSIQRRHQKLVEESPSPFVDAEMRQRLCAAAAQAARAVNYVGAGTVEFVAGPDRSFAFLEMNTRLQVEHPVTELVTGLDLVSLQFAVAEGEPLPPEVTGACMSGHAIEVRLCAEDPAAGHLPQSGTFEVFAFDTGAVRLDTGVGEGSEVPPYYDSMVAKVIAHAPTRRQAAARLAGALAEARLHGVLTNRDLLVRVLRSDEFLAGDTTTDFLERVPGLSAPLTGPGGHRVHALIAALALVEHDRRERRVQPSVPAGWRNNRSAPEATAFRLGDGTLTVEMDPGAGEGVAVVDGEKLEYARHGVERVGPGRMSLDVTVDRIRRRYSVAVTSRHLYVDSPLGCSDLQRVSRYPEPGEGGGPIGALEAPMPGRVVRTLVGAGQTVDAGQALVVMEAMKMEHVIASPGPGTVRAVHVAEGEQVGRGAVLVSVDPVSVDPVGGDPAGGDPAGGEEQS